jgi:pimeloyl-ACP methyl ester carboxylesterase
MPAITPAPRDTAARRALPRSPARRHLPQRDNGGGVRFALYAAGLRHKVRPGAVRGIFESMVDLSDHGELLAKFISLPCPRMFTYGEQDSSLSYLTKLSANDVELAEIPHSAHWPMYSNPVAMWERIAEFHSRIKPD